MSNEEVTIIVDEIAETYGVDPEDVTADVIYQTTGSVSMDITGDVSEEEIIENLEAELSAILGIHEGNVEVTIVDDVAYYTITSDSAEDAQDLMESLQEPDSFDALFASISESLPIVVTSVSVNDDIEAEVVVTVDTTGAENNLNNAAELIQESFENQGYVATADSNH